MAKPGGREVGGTVLCREDLVRRATSIVLKIFIVFFNFIFVYFLAALGLCLAWRLP